MMKRFKTGIPYALAALLWACATPPAPAPEPVPEPPAPEPVVEPAPPPPVVVAPPPKPAKPKAKKPKKTEPSAAASAPVASAPPAAAVPAAASEPVASAEPAIKGPAWLSRCGSKRLEGGVILCDSDSLIAQPSAAVKVFTRDPALAGKVSGGEVVLRSGLPRRYRFFVVP
ncbi:hypothetical protein [Niveibacterium sp. SC-1]|uniref:hypothetical protein n=1 Tax=Niveibacterium sp. SC-1 TaxID=3135646 RepID=UPI00311F3DF6